MRSDDLADDNLPMAYSIAPAPTRRRHAITFLMMILWMGIPAAGLQADGLSVDSELDLGTWSPFVSQWQSESTVCAWSDSSNDFYNVTASSLAAGSDFELTNDIGDSVAFSVYWRSSENSPVWENLLFGVLSSDTYAFASAAQCIGGPTAEVRVEIDKAEIDAALPGVYSDTLLLTVSPL